MDIRVLPFIGRYKDIYIYTCIYIWWIALTTGYMDTINEIQNVKKRDKKWKNLKE